MEHLSNEPGFSSSSSSSSSETFKVWWIIIHHLFYEMLIPLITKFLKQIKEHLWQKYRCWSSNSPSPVGNSEGYSTLYSRACQYDHIPVLNWLPCSIFVSFSCLSHVSIPFWNLPWIISKETTFTQILVSVPASKKTQPKRMCMPMSSSELFAAIVGLIIDNRCK